MDSSGLGVMVRIKKLAQHHGTKLVFQHVQPAVQNVIHLSRMEGIPARPNLDQAVKQRTPSDRSVVDRQQLGTPPS